MDFEIMLKYALFMSQVGTLLIVIFLSVQSRNTMAQETQVSEDFSMVMRPPAAGIDIDESELQGIGDFFHHAELAIQSENISTLMSLYSVNYTNQRSGDKQFAAELWNRIFASFDNISSRHSMKLIDFDKATGRATTECSGLLFGTPEGENSQVTIDRWDNQRHILVKEGDWKLLGNMGDTALRYGESDGELHPLF